MGFKAINDTILPEAFKPSALKKGEDREELFNRWRDDLLSAYELYSSSADPESMKLVCQTLKRLYNEGALVKNNRRTVKELQEKYIQLTMLMAREELLAEDGLCLLEDPLIKLHDLFPEALEIVLALIYVLIRQRKWFKAFHAAKYALRKQPFERNLIYFYLHSLFNLGLFDVFERERERYSDLVKYVPRRVWDPEEEFKIPIVMLTLEKPTWNALLKVLTELISKSKIWTCIVNLKVTESSESFSLDASGYNTPSQSCEMMETAEEENSQPTQKKRAASAQARKNLKKQKVVLKKNGAQFGFDLESFLKKYNLASPELPFHIQLIQDKLQVPQVELEGEIVRDLEDKFLLEVITVVLANVPESAWVLSEFIDFVQVLLEKNCQEMFVDDKMFCAIVRIFKEKRIVANKEKLEYLAYKRKLKEAIQYLKPSETDVPTKEMDSDTALEFILNQMDAFNLQTLIDDFLPAHYPSTITINSETRIAFLVLLSKKLILEKESQIKFLFHLYNGFIKLLELDESIYELAVMLQKNEILTYDLALVMALKCPSATYQWEILRALYRLGRIKNSANTTIEALSVFNEKRGMDLRTAQAITRYLEDCWQSIDCNLDEVALLKAIEIVLESITIRGSDQLVLQTNLGKMKRYFRTECHDIFNFTQNQVPPLLPVRSSKELELRKRVLKIRIEVCEDAFSNRKRNLEWLKTFRKDLMYMLVTTAHNNGEFAEYWEKITLVHFEIAYQLLSLDPFAIRGRENKVRRNLKKYAMMALLGPNRDYNRMTEALFMMLHSLVEIRCVATFQRKALAYLVKIFMKAKDLSHKSKLLCAIAMLQSENTMSLDTKNIGKEALMSWLHIELGDLHNADYELIYFACLFLDRLGCLPEDMLRSCLGIDIEHSVLSFIGPQFNLHKGKDELFPFLLKPKGLTFCGVHVPAILPGFTNFCVQELTKELIDGEEEAETLILVLNRLRVLEAQLPHPTELIIRCTRNLHQMAENEPALIDLVLKEARNNKHIPQVSAYVETLKVLKKNK